MRRPDMKITDMPAVSQAKTLFDTLALGSLALRNRLAVAPMTRVSANAEGETSDAMARYYGAFAKGGFGLVITEGIYTDKAYSQGYLYQPGLSDDRQRDAWGKVIDAVHAGGARIVAQLMHAGALAQGNRYRSETIGPSATRPAGQQMTVYRGAGDYPVPRRMESDDIKLAIQGFSDAALRAKQSGFDGVEIHAANGYLLDQFLSDGINLRNDLYGGDIVRRLMMIVEVVHAVRGAVGPEMTVGVRMSQAKVNDFTHKWAGQDEAAHIFDVLGQLPIDYLHTTEFEAWAPASDTGPSLAALARRHAKVPVIANGSLHDPARAGAMITTEQADMVSLGRGALTHADWPLRVRHGQALASFNPAILSPIADLSNADLYGNAAPVQA